MNISRCNGTVIPREGINAFGGAMGLVLPTVRVGEDALVDLAQLDSISNPVGIVLFPLRAGTLFCPIQLSRCDLGITCFDPKADRLSNVRDYHI